MLFCYFLLTHTREMLGKRSAAILRDRKTKAERRQADILRRVIAEGSLQARDLAAALNVSAMTIHRDLTELVHQGMIQRTHGTVSAEKTLLFESSYLFRARQNIEQKRRLAQAAVKLLEPGNAILWDDSSTTYHVCDFIDQVMPVTVLTNARPVIERLHERNDVDLIAIGGRYDRAYDGFFGIACERVIRSYHVDVALMSSTAVQGLSLYAQDEQVLQAKQAMIEVAHRKVLMVDATKFGFSALIRVAELTDFDTVIVPAETGEQTLSHLRDAGVTLQIV